MERSFIIGSDWLYYKIYTGTKATDSILTKVVLPLIEQFHSLNWIEKWFFIRYSDPSHHIRLRFLLTEKNMIPKILEKLYLSLYSFIEQDIVWKVQLDTYNRELERYGENTIELSESMFFHDSWATIQFLNLIEGEEGEQLRWLFGLRSTDYLLNAFEYTIEEKLSLLEGLKVGFGKEFNMSRPLKKQLDAKYRSERKRIEYFMSFSSKDENEYHPILEILENSYLSIRPIALELLQIEKENLLQISKSNLIESYIHMIMVRLFKSKNRMNEMVCYDFLYRFYRTQLAKKRL